MGRPSQTEHNEYFSRYVDLVPDGDILDILERQIEETTTLLASVPTDREEFRYAPGKWSLREVVGHILDVERAFGFRCLWIARGAEGALASFDQEAWARMSNAGSRSLADLVEEWKAVRHDHLLMFRGFTEEAWARVGVASGWEFSARSFPWIIAGHELYHRALLERDYLGGGA